MSTEDTNMGENSSPNGSRTNIRHFCTKAQIIKERYLDLLQVERAIGYLLVRSELENDDLPDNFKLEMDSIIEKVSHRECPTCHNIGHSDENCPVPFQIAALKKWQ